MHRLDEIQISSEPPCMPFRRDPDLDQATSHAVVSKPGTRLSHMASGCVGIQISSEPPCMPFRRVPELDQAARRAVVSKSGTRPSHMASGCIGIQIVAKPLCVRLGRDPDRGQATVCAAVSRSRSRPSHCDGLRCRSRRAHGCTLDGTNTVRTRDCEIATRSANLDYGSFAKCRPISKVVGVRG